MASEKHEYRRQLTLPETALDEAAAHAVRHNFSMLAVWHGTRMIGRFRLYPGALLPSLQGGPYTFIAECWDPGFAAGRFGT